MKPGFGLALDFPFAGAPGPRSGASATLIENCAFCPSNDSGKITVEPAAMPGINQPTVLSCRQASSTGVPALGSTAAAWVTRPASPTSTSSSTRPDTSMVSARAFSKQRFTSPPCFSSALCNTRDTRCSSVSVLANANVRAGAAVRPRASASSPIFTGRAIRGNIETGFTRQLLPRAASARARSNR